MQGQGDQAITAYYLYDVRNEKIWPKRMDQLIYILDAGIPVCLYGRDFLFSLL